MTVHGEDDQELREIQEFIGWGVHADNHSCHEIRIPPALGRLPLALDINQILCGPRTTFILSRAEYLSNLFYWAYSEIGPYGKLAR